MGRLTKKTMFSIAGSASIVLGAMFAFPGFMREQYLLAGVASVFLVGGVVLVGIALGD